VNRLHLCFILQTVNHQLEIASQWLDRITELPEDDYTREEVLQFIRLATEKQGLDIRIERLRQMHEKATTTTERRVS
jgi:uncharacterized damage-inducible protein DinB